MGTNSQIIIWRIVADFLLIIAALFLPWWAVFLIAIVFFFAFNRFFEIFLAAFLMDLLYAIPLPRFGKFEFVLSLISVPLYFILTLIKQRMRF